MTNKREHVIKSLLENKNSHSIVEYGHTFITYVSMKNMPCLAILASRGWKPIFHSSFAAVERRAIRMAEERGKAKNEYENNLAIQKEWEKRGDAITVGTILYSSWGYEQTNVDFYLVKERKGKTVTLIEIGQFRTYDSQDSGTCKANPNEENGEPFKKRVNKFGCITITSYTSASGYDGKPLRWSSYY